MSDIFSRISDNFGGSFSADSAFVTFSQDLPGVGTLAPGSLLGFGAGPTNGVGMLTQSLQFAYQQQVTKVFELGTPLSFYIAGRTNGSASMGRILGPRPLALAFYRKYGDVCNAATNHLDIELSTGCSSTPGGVGNYNQRFSLNMKYCVIVSIAVSMTAQDMIVNEQLSIMYASLDVSNVGVGGAAQQQINLAEKAQLLVTSEHNSAADRSIANTIEDSIDPPVPELLDDDPNFKKLSGALPG